MKTGGKPESGQPDSAAQMAIGLGYQFIAGMVVFVGAGYYLDRRRGGGHLFTLIGVALAFLYGGYEVWKLVRLLNQPPPAGEQKPGE